MYVKKVNWRPILGLKSAQESAFRRHFEARVEKPPYWGENFDRKVKLNLAKNERKSRKRKTSLKANGKDTIKLITAN